MNKKWVTFLGVLFFATLGCATPMEKFIKDKMKMDAIILPPGSGYALGLRLFM